MKPKIFLHIGMDKTGTTAIQQFFHGNRDELINHGLLYPQTGSQGIAHYGLSQVLGFYHGKKKASEESEFKELAREFKHELEKSNAHTVLFSSEFFMISKPVQSIEMIRLFFSAYDIKIIIYLRRHDSWWESVYNQAVKTVTNPPWGRGFEHFINFQKKRNPRRGNYRLLIDTWANVFGKENIIVRPYESQQNQPNMIGDILKTIGFQSLTQQMEIVSARTNESLPSFTLSLIDAFQRADIDPHIRNHLIKHSSSIPKSSGPSVSVIPPLLRRQLVDENLPDYEYIAKNYLGRKNGKIFHDPLPDPDEAWQAPRQANLANIVEQTVAAMTALNLGENS